MSKRHPKNSTVAKNRKRRIAAKHAASKRVTRTLIDDLIAAMAEGVHLLLGSVSVHTPTESMSLEESQLARVNRELSPIFITIEGVLDNE